MEGSGNLNLLMRRYFMHLASLMHPLSSWREYLYEMPTITAFLRPWKLGGGPGGAWKLGEGPGTAYGWGGRARGSGTGVTAWQRAQRMDPAPGGSCSGVRQLEQLTSMLLYMAAGW